MALKDYLRLDSAYMRLERLLDALDAKVERALYAKGKDELFCTRMKGQQWVYGLQVARALELRNEWEREAA